jgi:hypothetical protein
MAQANTKPTRPTRSVSVWTITSSAPKCGAATANSRHTLVGAVTAVVETLGTGLSGGAMAARNTTGEASGLGWRRPEGACRSRKLRYVINL